MPHILAFEVDADSLLVAVAQTTARNMNVQHTFDIKLTEEDTDEEIGQRLRRWLNSHSINKAEAIGIVSRSTAEIREITVPPSPDNELPDLVRFQARSDFGSLNDNWAFDYVPFGGDPEKPRQVLAVAITPEQTARLKDICESATVKLKHIVFRPYASIDLLRMRMIDGRCRVLVDETGEETDISLTRGRDLIATRTVRIPQSDDDAQRIKHLLREIRRTIASLNQRLEGEPISEVVICGENNESIQSLEKSISKDLDVNTLVVEPFEYVSLESGFEFPHDPQNYTALLGALCQDISDDQHAIDFLNPRRPVIQRTDFSKYLRVGAIAASGLFLMSFIGWWMLSSQKGDIADLREKIRKQVNLNESVDDPANNAETLLATVEPIDDFLAAVPNWLDELYEVSGRLQTPDDVIVDKLDAGLGRSNGKLTIKTRINKSLERKINTDLIQRPYDVENKRATTINDGLYSGALDYDLYLDFSSAQETKREMNRQAVEMLQERFRRMSESTESETPSE